jgi:hypothetical protein
MEDTTDLRQTSAQPTRKLGVTDTLLTHRVIERGLAIPSADSATDPLPAQTRIARAKVPL